MNDLFLSLLNMSLTASYVAIIIIGVRWVLKKIHAPNILCYALWIIMLFRLVSPISFESDISFIPKKVEIGSQITHIQQLEKQEKIDTSANKLTKTSPNPTETPAISNNIKKEMNLKEWFLNVIPIIWLFGVICLLLYLMISYIRLRKKISIATIVKDNIFQTDRIQTPFVFGLMKPRIYIPINFSQQEADYVIEHEKVHIRRKDHLVKLIGFLALTLHWFNPLIWLSYMLMVKDMEMSCDESVIKKYNRAICVNYSKSLLSLSERQSGLFTSIPFKRNNVKSRVKNILHYKRPASWVVIIICMVLLLLSINLLTNPRGTNMSLQYKAMINTIKNIEISENKLITLNTTFDEYKQAFEGKFITENLEKHFIGEDQGAAFPYGLVLKGDIDQEFLDDPMKHVDQNSEVNVVSLVITQKLTKIDFSRLYLNDAKDKATIYAKKLYEYHENDNFSDIKDLDIIKSQVLIEKYIFKKVDNQWKIMSTDEKFIEYIGENQETGEEELVVFCEIMHQNEEIEYIKTIEVDEN